MEQIRRPVLEKQGFASHEAVGPSDPRLRAWRGDQGSLRGAIRLDSCRIYQKDYGLAPELTPCTEDVVEGEWKNRYGLVTWWTHGYKTGAEGVFTSDRCASLDDSRPSFVFQCSCQNAWPEEPNNLAYALLNRGAVNVIGATRDSWYQEGDLYWAFNGTSSWLAREYSGGMIREKLFGPEALRDESDRAKFDSGMVDEPLRFQCLRRPRSRIGDMSRF